MDDGRVDPAMDERAGQILRQVLRRLQLPPVQGVPTNEQFDKAADAMARRILALLEEVYGRPLRGLADAQRVYLAGAFAAWKGRASFEERGRLLRVTTVGCPIVHRVALDRGICYLCQRLHRAVLQRIAGTAIDDVFYENTAAVGDGSCTLWVAKHPTPKQTGAGAGTD